MRMPRRDHRTAFGHRNRFENQVVRPYVETTPDDRVLNPARAGYVSCSARPTVLRVSYLTVTQDADAFHHG